MFKNLIVTFDRTTAFEVFTNPRFVKTGKKVSAELYEKFSKIL